MMRSLQHYAFEVPDLEVGRRFYTDFGLEGEEVGDTVVMRCAGRDQDQVVMREGSKKRLHHISLGTSADEIDGMREALGARGVAFEDPPFDGAPDGLWFRDPDDLLVNVHIADDTPARPEPEVEVNARGHYHRLDVRGVPEDPVVSRPRRLGHILLFTRSVPAKVEFYTGALGMKLSDTMGGDIVGFLRNGNDGDHHVIALAKSETPGFHHSSWEFGTVDDIGVATANMFERGHTHCWGFGRHVVGSNYFHYFRDPWGSLIEHFTDIDVIAEGGDWEPKDWPLDGNLSRWATEDAPDDFLMNSEAAA
jgi:catechol 2,3-dioxygenase-like lactoylglutathione lyase family enzyme